MTTRPNRSPDPEHHPGNPSLQLPDASIRALIVERHEPTRLGTAVLLRRQPWVARCLLAPGGEEAAILAIRHRPDIALLDISNAGPFVAAAVGTLRDAHPGVAVVLTSRCHVKLAGPPASLGAAAFLPPGSANDEIVAAARAAALSLDYVQTASAEKAVIDLTDRDLAVLALISEGATNREIAGRLHLGPDAVKKNASALYRKLGVRNRTEAAQRAAQILG